MFNIENSADCYAMLIADCEEFLAEPLSAQGPVLG